MPPARILTEHEKRIKNLSEQEALNLSPDDKTVRARLLANVRQSNYWNKKKGNVNLPKTNKNQILEQAQNVALKTVETIKNTEYKNLLDEIKALKEKITILEERNKEIDVLKSTLANFLRSNKTFMNNVHQTLSTVSNIPDDVLDSLKEQNDIGLLGNKEIPLKRTSSDLEIENFLPTRLIIEKKTGLPTLISKGTLRLDISYFKKIRQQFPLIKNNFYGYIANNFDFIKEKLRSEWNPADRQQAQRFIVAMLQNMQNVDPQVLDNYNQMFYAQKANNEEKYSDKSNNEQYAVPNINDFNNRVEEKVKNETNKLYIDIIKLNPLRDNYENMVLTYNKPTDKTKNYMYITKTYAQPILYVFKTQNVYDKIEGLKIEGNLFKRLLSYIDKYNFKEVDKLFSGINKKVREELLKIGIRNKQLSDKDSNEINNTLGGVNNFFRHLVVSSLYENSENLDEDKLADKKQKYAKLFGHSVLVQRTLYKRVVNPNYFNNVDQQQNKQRGRPKKITTTENASNNNENIVPVTKKTRGRPKKQLPIQKNKLTDIYPIIESTKKKTKELPPENPTRKSARKKGITLNI